MALADGLCRRLFTVWASLAAGDIDLRRAHTIIHGTDHLATGPARVVAESVLDEAPELTTGQLAARLRRACIEADPDEAQSRYEVAVDQRRVVTEATPSGTATLLGMDLPPHRLAAGMRRLDRLARAMRREGKSRTMDQLRADVLLDLLAGTGVAVDDTSGSGDRGMVDIHVDLGTLSKLRDSPGELAGYGPVIADIARQTAAAQRAAEWRFTVTDADGGDIVLTGLTRYRPTAPQRRWVHALYPTCVWPGCRMPARNSDLDHRRPHAEGGPTSVGNLAPLCRFHHCIRHRHGWRYRRLPNGDHEWTSPLGRIHITPRRPP